MKSEAKNVLKVFSLLRLFLRVVNIYKGHNRRITRQLDVHDIDDRVDSNESIDR